MKEKIKIIVLIVIFVTLLIITNNLLNKSKEVQNITEVEVNNNVEENKTNMTTSVISSFGENNSPGLYRDILDEKTGEVIEVTETNFEEVVLNSNKKILIEFYADWCNPCKTLAPILEDIAKENIDIKVVKINVDENPNLASIYGVNSVPLLVVMRYGEEIDYASGAISKEAILELIR